MNVSTYNQNRKNNIIKCLIDDTARSKLKIIDIARTANWFFNLCSKTNSYTAYKLGKKLQPDTYRKSQHSDGKFSECNNNMWAKYASGVHKPSRALLKSIETKIPGSLSNYDHVIFNFLDFSNPIANRGTDMLKKLHPTLQLAIFKESKHASYLDSNRKELSCILSSLEGFANLDSMAACIVLLREANENKNNEAAFKIGKSIYQISLMACAFSDVRSIAQEIGIFIIEDLLPLASTDEIIYSLEFKDYLSNINWLNWEILKLEDNFIIGCMNKDSCAAAKKIFHGGYGSDLEWALKLPIKVRDDCMDVTERAKSSVKFNNYLRDWGREVIKSGRMVRLIPKSVFKNAYE